MRLLLSLRRSVPLLLWLLVPRKSAACACSGTTWISDDEMQKQIRSPNYPADYPNDCDNKTDHGVCVWEIERKRNWGIRLVLDDFNIEAGYDHVVIEEYRLDPTLEGNQLVITQLAKLTGCYADRSNHCVGTMHEFVTPVEWNVSNAEVRLQFSSDETGTRSGFQFSFRRYPLDEPTTSAEPPRDSSSPRFPSAYPWHHIFITILVTIASLCMLLLVLFFVVGLTIQKRRQPRIEIDVATPPGYEDEVSYNAAQNEVELGSVSQQK